MNATALPAERHHTGPQLAGRRDFLRKIGIATAGGAGLFALGGGSRARAASAAVAPAGPTETDVAVLNFALNLEYLEAEFYLNAVTGMGLKDAGIDVDGSDGTPGENVNTKKNPKVNFTTKAFRQYAEEIAEDEMNHVRFLREALAANGAPVIARPKINLERSFKTLGEAIGVKNFDPFQDEVHFLIGAFIFEDVGVTAYKGASPLLTDKGILEAAAGLLGVEAYHAGIIRVLLYNQPASVRKIIKKISRLRGQLTGPDNWKDQDLHRNGRANLVPTDGNSLVFSRSTREVLNIVYGAPDAGSGLFFPHGLNGAIH
jgi:hypothetical protein